MTTTSDAVPATPVYLVTVEADGRAAIDGVEVTGPGPDPAAARIAALAEVRIKAAFHGRPVRVLARDADGSSWPLTVAVDGTVTTSDTPHPVPEVEQEAPGAPEPPVRTREELPGTGAEFGAPTGPGTPDGFGPSAGLGTSAGSGALLEFPAPDWAGAVPARHRGLWERLVGYERADDVSAAAEAAEALEGALADDVGPFAHATVNVLTVRAWLSLRHARTTRSWAPTAELLVHAAECRTIAGTGPAEDTAWLIGNARAACRLLTRTDAACAEGLDRRLAVITDRAPTPP